MTDTDIHDADVVDDGQTVQPVTVESAVQPADIVDEAASMEQAVDDDEDQTPAQREASKAVALSLRSAGLDLTLRAETNPDTLLETPLGQALQGKMNFNMREPGAYPQVLAYLHMCIKRGLDPLLGEAHLIARGVIEFSRDGTTVTKNTRKYTMQTGIDGYRILAARTGKFVSVDDRVWTGQEADDSAYWRDTRGIMRRTWYDQWPDSKEQPGAARVTIVHYDDRGLLVNTDFQANWDMFCPTVDEWVGPSGSRRKTGNKAPTDMWIKGGPHMLSKCAEAGGHRAAFPGGMSGLYIPEELHRLAQDEDERAAATKAQEARQRVLAYAAAATRPIPEPGEPQPEPPAAQEPDGEHSTPEPPQEPETAQAPAQEPERPVEDHPLPDAPADKGEDADAIGFLVAEAEWMASLWEDTTADQRFRRTLDKAGVAHVADLPVDVLAEAVFRARKAVAGRLRGIGREAEADHYGNLPAGTVGPVKALLSSG